MKPLKFEYANITFAKNQPEYMPLPAWTDGNQVVSGWSVSWRERLQILFNGVIWIRQVTLGHPLQPLRPQALSPFPKMPMVPNDNLLRGTQGAQGPVGEPLKSIVEPVNASKVGPTQTGNIIGPTGGLQGIKGPTNKKLEPMDE